MKGIRHLSINALRILVVLAAVLVLPPVLSAAALHLEGERAWLKADGESLAEIMQLFREQGAKVFIDPQIKIRRISGDWNDVDVSLLIVQLANPNSYMLEWQKDQRQFNGSFRISSIRIFPGGESSIALAPLPADKALDVVKGENGVQYIRGEILVGFRQDSSIDDVEALLDTLNGELIDVIKPPGLYRIRLNGNTSVEEAMRLALRQRGVVATEPNLAFSAIVSPTNILKTTDEGVDLHLQPGETTVAVLDSGLDPAYANSPFIRGTYNALDPAAGINDPNGHGTLTSLIAAGAITPLGAQKAEKGVPVLSIRTFDANGMTSTDTIMRALSYARNSGVRIVSMSWGTEVASHFLEAAMEFASQNGMTLYAAAGNQPTGTPIYPAGYKSVVAVGGLNPDGSRWQNSNYGDFVDTYQPALANFNNQSYAGTSIASPYAAFKAALGSSK